jgi:hypothetical protein
VKFVTVGAEGVPGAWSSNVVPRNTSSFPPPLSVLSVTVVPSGETRKTSRLSAWVWAISTLTSTSITAPAPVKVTIDTIEPLSGIGIRTSGLTSVVATPGMGGAAARLEAAVRSAAASATAAGRRGWTARGRMPAKQGACRRARLRRPGRSARLPPPRVTPPSRSRRTVARSPSRAPPTPCWPGRPG